MSGDEASSPERVPEEAPDPDYAAELLRERHLIPARFAVLVSFPESEKEHPHVQVCIDRPKEGRRPLERFILEIKHQEGGPEKERWPLTMNAADALVGTLVESDYAHRDLPAGDGLEFEGVQFGVLVSCVRPELEAEADRWLAAHPDLDQGSDPTLR